MASIKCPECGTQVSDKAALCPQCGRPINVEQESGLRKGFRASWMLIVVLALVLGLFALLGTCHWKPV